MSGHLATHLQCDQVMCPGSHGVHLIHGRRGIETIHVNCCLYTGVQSSCTITTIFPSLLDFYLCVCKTSWPALPPDRCDVTPLQVCSTILGSHIMKRECQVLSPLPRAVSPTFPNQSEPLHYWCQVSVSRTDTLYRPAVTAPDALHSLSLRRSCLDSHDSLSLPHPLMYV